MRNRKLFALNGEARGAARLEYEDIGGTLAVELAPRGAGEYEAWLVPPKGPLLRAALGPAMTAAVPAAAKDASGVFVTGAGRIVAGGGIGLTRADMESAALRVQLALAEGRRAAELRKKEHVQPEPPEVQQTRTKETPEAEAAVSVQSEAVPERERPAAPLARETIPASRVAESRFGETPDARLRRMREERAAQIVREASAGPEVKSRAAMSIASAANRLFYPTEADYAQTSYAEPKAAVQRPVPNNAGQSVRRNMANAKKPMQPAQRGGAYPPMNRQRSRMPRGRSGGPR
jgi:hypothetical protein